MNKKSKDDTLTIIKSLYPVGNTNLWDGIKVGLSLTQ